MIDLNTFQNVELLRRPEGIDWPGGFDKHPFVDLATLPNDEYRLLLFMLSQHGRTTNPALKYGMNGLMQSMFPDARKHLDLLFQRGYFRDMQQDEVLRILSVAKLKEVASILGIVIKSNAKKAEILDSLLPYAKSSEISTMIEFNKVFELSDKGFLMARSLYAEREQVEKTIFGLLLEKDFSLAEQKWSNYKNRQHGRQDLQAKINPVIRNMINIDNEQVSFLACTDLYGSSPMFYPEIVLNEETLYIFAIEKAKIEIQSFQESNINRYKFNCAFDYHTCKICAMMDGRVFDIMSAEITINYPPLHSGCRCHASPILERYRNSEEQRFSRNPLTNLGSHSTEKDYKKWELSLSKEERAALKEKRNW